LERAAREEKQRQAGPALANIKEASGEALRELRNALDLLRHGEEAPVTPAPTLAICTRSWPELGPVASRFVSSRTTPPRRCLPASSWPPTASSRRPGLTNDEIAQRLLVSGATAKTHVSRAMIKVGARDRAQLVVFAYEAGLVRPGWSA
jgi:hypothetical protein